MRQIITLPEALSPAECDRLIADVQAAGLNEARLAGGAQAPRLRRAGVAWLDDIAQTGWVMGRMVRLVGQANRDGFGFDLDEFGESPQVARYGAENAGHFGWHSDIAAKGGPGLWAAKRKLTVVVQLSDPAGYSGGGLEIWPDSHVTEAPRARGTATVFPSFALHRVTPVTQGERWSLTLWAHGPAFR